MDLPKSGGRPVPPASADIRTAPRLLPAARIVLTDGFTVTALPRDRAAWGRLCRLISKGRLRAEKGSCALRIEDLLEWGEGLDLLIHPRPPGLDGEAWKSAAQRLTRRFGDQCHLLLAPRYDGQDPQRFASLTRLADRLGIGTVASAAPIMHHGARRRLTDVLTAIRAGHAGRRSGAAAQANAEQRLRSEAEMRRIFAGLERRRGPRRRDRRAADLRHLASLRYEYPSEIAEGETAADRLEAAGARRGCTGAIPQALPRRCADDAGA